MTEPPEKSRNKLSWKEPTRILESNSWPCTEPSPRVTLCLRMLSKCSLSSISAAQLSIPNLAVPFQSQCQPWPILWDRNSNGQQIMDVSHFPAPKSSLSSVPSDEGMNIWEGNTLLSRVCCLSLPRLPLTMEQMLPSPPCWTRWTFSCCQSPTLMDLCTLTPR